MLRKNACVAGAVGLSMLTAAPVWADVDITGGNLRVGVVNPNSVVNVAPVLGMNSGYATYSGNFANQSFATYTLQNDGFQISDIHFERSATGVAYAIGTIDFVVDEQTFYTFDMNYTFSSTGTGGGVGSEIQLQDLTANSYQIDYFHGGSGTNGTRDSTNVAAQGGILSDELIVGHTYRLYYYLYLASTDTTVDTASGDASISLIFSNTGVPEPASIGILALVAGGLLLRRGK